MKPLRGAWDFPYQPTRKEAADDREGAFDVVVATRVDVAPGAFERALACLGETVSVQPLLARAPLFWTRVRSASPLRAADVTASLAALPVRYVVSAVHETMRAAPTLAFTPSQRIAPATETWPVRKRRQHAEAVEGGRWFLGGGGIAVDRKVCGTGAGTRLAVIDNETADFEHLEVDRLVHVGVERAPATTGHAALMVAWSTGAVPVGAPRFSGVAPDASVRLYCIPRPGGDVVSLPLALARAVFDGADVVVCATYLEGTGSPLLDDALDVATYLGRRGRGTVVVIPTGRETASPGDSIHASLSLGLGDPASDRRVHCIAPGGRGGGWFLWSNARGQVRPFANRGPAVRWTTPGDDISYPFASRDRLFHSESSGASAIAAGVILLVLANNPSLRLPELHALLARTVDTPVDAPVESLADPVDILPRGYDRDGHNAKTGYGRLHATRACMGARDPVALELTAMGHDDAAARWLARPRPYSRRLARWVVRQLLTRGDLGHGSRVLLRHARLVGSSSVRGAAHARGSMIRALAVLLRDLGRARPPSAVGEELARWVDRLSAPKDGPDEAAIEGAACALFQELDHTRDGPEATRAKEVVLTASLRS